MNWFLIPLVGTPQTFQIALAGVNYIFTFKWNDALDAGWEFDIEDSDTGIPLLAGAPLITGADCLSGLEYLGINGQLFVYTDGNPDAVPTFDNLGSESNVYFVTSAVA